MGLFPETRSNPCLNQLNNLTMKTKYIIEDEFSNLCFDGKAFDTYEDGWEFLYETFPVIYHEDGTRDDQEDELSSYFVLKAAN
jgi:hypothetical protein